MQNNLRPLLVFILTLFMFTLTLFMFIMHINTGNIGNTSPPEIVTGGVMACFYYISLLQAALKNYTQGQS